MKYYLMVNVPLLEQKKHLLMNCVHYSVKQYNFKSEHILVWYTVHVNLMAGVNL